MVKNFNIKRVEELLEQKRQFIVPPNQRLYMWDREKWKEFWEDLMDIEESKRNKSQDIYKKTHFFGPMFFINQNNKIEILDGQQRLITITLLLQVIYDLLDELRSINSPGFTEKGIMAVTRIINCLGIEKEGKIEYRLTLDKQNNQAYSYLLKRNDHPYDKISGLRMRGDTPSRKAIFDCYNYFLNCLLDKFIEQKGLKLNSEKDYLQILKLANFEEFLKRISESIMEGFYVLENFVPDRIVGYEMFETLNQRGVKLFATDLFKNFIFSKFESEVGESDLTIFWEDLMKISKEKNLSVFLRHYWLSKYDFVREIRLFSAIRDKLKSFDSTQAKFQELSKDLLEEAEVYFALNYPESPLWEGKEKLILLIDELKYLAFTQYKPIVLAAYFDSFKNDPKKFEKLLEAFRNFAVRRYVLSKKRANEFEEEYSKMARNLRSKNITIDYIINFFNESLISYESIKHQMTNQGLNPSVKAARYLLTKMNDSITPNPLMNSWKNNPTLEHVIPQSPDSEWKLFLSNEKIIFEEIVGRLGNLTILDKGENNELGNMKYPEKKKRYLDKKLPINLFTFDKIDLFNVDAIKLREEIFCELMKDKKIFGD